MLTTYFNPTVIIEWCCFIASFVFLVKNDKWRVFTLFLFLTLIAESTGWYFRFILHVRNNNWIFNLLLLISVAFFTWIFSEAPQFLKLRGRIKKAAFILLLVSLVNLFLLQGYWTYNTYTEVGKDIFLSVLCCYFFFIILKEENFINLFKYEYFWLATGLLFYCLGNIVFYLFLDVFRNFYKETSINLVIIINSVLNILLYVSLIIAFICRAKNIK